MMRSAAKFFCFSLLSLLLVSSAFAKSEPLKGKALLSQPAGKAYLFGDYEGSLAALAEKASLSGQEQLLKAKNLYYLGRYQETKTTLEALPKKEKNSELARYWLAHTLYQLRDKSGAETAWTELAQEKSVLGQLSANNVTALAKKSSIAPLAQKKPSLTEDAFLATPAAQLYKNKQYGNASIEFQKLASRYPNEAIVHRYMGMTQMELKQPEKAIESYKKGLAANPWNAALHMELAKAYKKTKASDLSKREYEFVRDYDESGLYSTPAKKALEKKSKKKSKSFLPKKLKVRGGLGWQWANNVKSASEVPKVRKPGDRNASKYRYNLGAIYEVWANKAWTVSLDTALDHSYYDDSFDEKNTYVHAFGLSLTYETKLWDKPLKFVVRQGEAHTTKKTGYFSFAHVTTTAMNYKPSKHYEFTLYNRWGYTSFDRNGRRKDETGKNGPKEEVGLSQKYMPTKNKDLFLTFDIAYIKARPNGVNGIMDAIQMSSGIGTPLLLGFLGEFSVTYKRDDYPDFEFPASKRQRKGNILGVDVSLERDITKKLTWIATYAWDIEDNNNSSYRKNNHTFGTGLKFKV